MRRTKRQFKNNKRPVQGVPEVRTVTNYDHWYNEQTNLGAQSRANLTRYAISNPLLSKSTLESMYRNEGIVRKIVDIYVDEALRSFIQAEEGLIEELDRLKVKKYLMDACKDARLFGGSMIVAFIDDGKNLDEELDLTSIRKVVQFRSYDCFQVTWSPQDINTDYLDDSFGEPLIYKITPVTGTAFNVHRSRVWKFSGARVPSRSRYVNNGWDDSVLQSIYEHLRNLGNTYNSCAEIVQEFTLGVLYIDGLNEIMKSKNSELEKRLHHFKMRRSTANMITLDSVNEKYEKLSSTVTGLPDLLDRFTEVISATTDIPQTKLLGRAPGGLNSTGKHDESNWNNKVEEYRNLNIKPALEWILELVEAQQELKEGLDFQWEFKNLNIPDVEEAARVKLINAQMDQIYMDRSAVDPAMLFKKRYEEGEYNPNIIMSDKDLNELEVKEESIDPDTLQIMQDELLEQQKENKDLQNYDSQSDADYILDQLITEKLSKFNV